MEFTVAETTAESKIGDQLKSCRKNRVITHVHYTDWDFTRRRSNSNTRHWFSPWMQSA